MGQTSDPDIRIILPRPHIHQQKFLDSKAKRKVIRAGRRGGKTIGASILAVLAFLQGRRVLYAVPTSEQMDAFWTSCTQMLQPALDMKLFTKNESNHKLKWPERGAQIRAKTAWNADTLRGDHADLLILDEYQLMAEDAWGVVGAPMLLDNNGDAVFIYTPPSVHSTSVSKAKDKRHATKFFQRAKADTTGRWETFTFTSIENPYLSTEALQDITNDMSQRAYRQEILAEELDDVPGALWTRDLLDRQRVDLWEVPQMVRIVVGVDPKASSAADSETGIVVAGQGVDHHYYVLDDRSTDGTPEVWGKAVHDAFNKWNADRVVVEINQGGEMVRQVLDSLGIQLPITEVYATRSKQTRAEPIVAYYERGIFHHAGNFLDLEDVMCTWLPGTKSPDRMDAAVWAAYELAKGLSATTLVDFSGNTSGEGSQEPSDDAYEPDNILSDMFHRLPVSVSFGRFGL